MAYNFVTVVNQNVDIFKPAVHWLDAGGSIQVGIMLLTIFAGFIPLTTATSIPDGLAAGGLSLVLALTGLFLATSLFRIRPAESVTVARSVLVDRLNDGMLVLDRTGKVLDLNQAARFILNVEPEGGLGQPVSAIFPEWPELSEKTIPVGRQWIEIPIQHGEKIDYYELQVSSIELGENQPDGKLVILHDITERRSAREALSRLNTELEERVAQRTRDLRRRAEELSALAFISSALRIATSLNSMLTILIEQTSRAIAADRGAILLTGGDSLEMMVVHGFPASLLGARFKLTEPVFQDAFNSGKPVVLTPRDITLQNSEITSQVLSGCSLAFVAPLQLANMHLGILLLAFSEPAPILEDHLRLLTAVAEMAGNAIRRVQLMETLENRVAERTRELTALYDITALTNEYQDLQPALERVLRKTLDVFNSPAGLLHLLEDDEETLNLAVHYGLEKPMLEQIAHWRQDQTLWGQVIKNNQVTVYHGLRLTATGNLGENRDERPVYIGVPIHSKGRLLGALSIYGESGKRFSQEDIALLAAIADHVGSAVEQDQLRHQARQAAVMEERQRLGRELHDSVTQSLYSLVLFADAVNDADRAGDRARVEHYIERLADTARQALKEMRLLIFEMRPTTIKEVGLAAALRQRLEAVERRAGIEPWLTVEQWADLPEEVEFALYRVAQEALNNVLKHAGAHRVEVVLSAMEGWVRMDIVDDGRGFNPDSVQNKGGLGLISMEERACQFNGTFTIQSKPGQGTRVMARIPFTWQAGQ